MEYKKMGRTGLKVSELSLGCWLFDGITVKEAEAELIIHKALDAGINFLDTADSYGRGLSEEIIGKAIKGQRDKVIIATKVGLIAGAGPNDMGLSRAHIMKSIEGSLRRLGCEYIDLYYAHLWDPLTHIEESLRAFDDLVRQGKVRYIGCSNFAAWQLCKSLWISDLRNLVRFDCHQIQYSLVCRDVEVEILPLCAAEGVGVTVWSPLAMGFLTGKYRSGVPAPEGTRGAEHDGMLRLYGTPHNYELLAKLDEFSQARQRTLPEIALRWVMDNPLVASAVIGVRKVEQLGENLKSVGWRLTLDEKEELDAMSRVGEPYPQNIYRWGSLYPPKARAAE